MQFLHGGNQEQFFDGGDMTTVPAEAALTFTEGKLQIENTLWRESEAMDVKVPYPFQWGEYSSQLSIVNSNFEYPKHIAEGTPSNTFEIEEWPNIAVAATGPPCPKDQMCQSAVTLRNNYYGDIKGPKGDVPHSDAFLRFGKQVLGYVDFAGYRDTKLIVDPLIVIPGIMGSQKRSDGTWVMDPIAHVYDDLLASLKKNGYEEEKNLFSFPYDWYRKNEETAVLLKQKISEIRAETGSEKVDIVAHSMGGLVAGSYAEMDGQAQYIDQLITLGTPSRGAPEAYLKWEAGEGFFTLSDKLIKHHFTQEAEESGYADIHDFIQEKIPSVQQLLSIDNYLFDTTTHTMRTYPEGYPRNIFLEQLAANSASLGGIRRRMVIAGNVGETTITKIRVTNTTEGEKWKDGKPENFGDKQADQGLENSSGDQTVPLESAQAAFGDSRITLDAKHSDLPEAAQCSIVKELSGKESCSEMHEIDTPNILYLNLFSPIDIQIISPSGKRVGKNFENGSIYDEIPGAFYTGYHTDNEFVTIPNPEKGEYRVLTQGTGTGKYRIEIAHISENEKPGKPAEESIVTLSGTAQTDMVTEELIIVTDDVVSVPDEPVDTLPPVTQISLSGTQGQHDWYTSPVTISLNAQDEESGIKKTEYSLDDGHSWIAYAAPFTLTNEGKTLLQYRSTDQAGNQEVTHTDLIQIDMTPPEARISFHLETQRLDIVGEDTVDQNMPLPTVQVTDTPIILTAWQKWMMKFWGATFPTTRTTLTATLVDAAGRNTILTFDQVKKQKNRLFLTLQSIDSGGVITKPMATIQYKWHQDKNQRIIRLASSLHTQDDFIETHYLSVKDVTRLMRFSRELADDDSDDDAGSRLVKQKLPGMVIPGILTEQGMVRIMIR